MLSLESDIILLIAPATEPSSGVSLFACAAAAASLFCSISPNLLCLFILDSIELKSVVFFLADPRSSLFAEDIISLLLAGVATIPSSSLSKSKSFLLFELSVCLLPPLDPPKPPLPVAPSESCRSTSSSANICNI